MTTGVNGIGHTFGHPDSPSKESSLAPNQCPDKTTVISIHEGTSSELLFRACNRWNSPGQLWSRFGQNDSYSVGTFWAFECGWICLESVGVYLRDWSLGALKPVRHEGVAGGKVSKN